MQSRNMADENFRKLAELFPNVVTETIDENGKIVRAIDKDILLQEISVKSLMGEMSVINSLGRVNVRPFSQPMPLQQILFAHAVKRV